MGHFVAPQLTIWIFTLGMHFSFTYFLHVNKNAFEFFSLRYNCDKLEMLEEFDCLRIFIKLI